MTGDTINGEMLVLSGNANRPLAEDIADYLGLELGEADVSRFIDGEIKVQIKSQVRDLDVFVVQPVCNSPDVPASPNDNLVELGLTIDALRRASAKRVTAVVPYYGYARQDRKDRPRVPISGRWVANLLSMSGAHRVLTFDLHADQIQGFFDIEPQVDHVTAAPGIFMPHIRNTGLEDLVVAGADAGGDKFVTRFATLMGTDMAYIDKRRLNDREVKVMAILGDVVGRNVIIVDDICSSGGTLVEAARAYKEAGAENVYAAITHGVFCGPALERIKDSPIKELWVTDSIPQARNRLPGNIKVLSAAKLLGEAIRRIHNGGSISELYAGVTA